MSNLKANEAKKEILSKDYRKIFEISDDDERLVEELDFEIFISILRFKSSQFNASCLERRLILKGCEKIPPSLNKGDFKFPKEFNFEKNIELKISFPNSANKINIRQIRLWQDCDYIVGFLDYNNITNSKLFFLTHEQMKKEVERRGYSTHGTSAANEHNENVEMFITINVNSNAFDCYNTDSNLKQFIFS